MPTYCLNLPLLGTSVRFAAGENWFKPPMIVFYRTNAVFKDLLEQFFLEIKHIFKKGPVKCLIRLVHVVLVMLCLLLHVPYCHSYPKHDPVRLQFTILHQLTQRRGTHTLKSTNG